MNVAASITFSMGICALWAVTFTVAAYCAKECRRVRLLLLVLALFLLVKDIFYYVASGAAWLPGAESHPLIYELYRIVMAAAGAILPVLLLLHSRKDTVQQDILPEPAEKQTAEEPAHALLEEVADDDSLLSRFQHLLVYEQLFLRPQLTLPEVAELLHTNKTYLSKLVNDHYKVSFPELINTLRIDYAEQYILNNREVRQEEVARACGFVSASSFNNTFKKVAGMPPKQWVTNWDASHKN